MKKQGREDQQSGAARPDLESDRRRGFLQAMSASLAAASLSGAASASVPAGPATNPMRIGGPKRWDESVDVIIIGSGFAGRAAAAEAAARGSRVLILEKAPITGGNSVINGGGYNAWTDDRKMRETLKLGDDSAELHLKDTLAGGDYFNIPALARVMVEGSPDALNWMLNEGDLKLKNVLARIGGHSAYRDHISLDGTGRGFIDALIKIGTAKGVRDVRLNTAVSWIYRDGFSGPVLGVEVTTRKGKRNVRATQAVVLASGGFGRDLKLRLSVCPTLTDAYNSTNQPLATGEMIRYAQAIGADTLHMGFIQLYPTADPDGGLLDKYALYPSRMPSYGGVFVSTDGKRFVSELSRRDVVARAEIGTGKDRAFCVFNEAMISKVTTMEEVAGGIEAERVWKADSIAALAKLMGVPPEALEATIKDHNQYLADGKDPQFAKPFTKVMLPLDKGPFYAVAQWPSVHHTMGGLRIDTGARVIDIWGDPIPRLFAAGEVAGGVHGNNRLGANATPEAIVFGRVAGTNAAKTARA